MITHSAAGNDFVGRCKVEEKKTDLLSKLGKLNGLVCKRPQELFVCFLLFFSRYYLNVRNLMTIK